MTVVCTHLLRRCAALSGTVQPHRRCASRPRPQLRRHAARAQPTILSQSTSSTRPCRFRARDEDRAADLEPPNVPRSQAWTRVRFRTARGRAWLHHLDSLGSWLMPKGLDLKCGVGKTARVWLQGKGRLSANFQSRVNTSVPHSAPPLLAGFIEQIDLVGGEVDRQVLPTSRRGLLSSLRGNGHCAEFLMRKPAAPSLTLQNNGVVASMPTGDIAPRRAGAPAQRSQPAGLSDACWHGSATTSAAPWPHDAKIWTRCISAQVTGRWVTRCRCLPAIRLSIDSGSMNVPSFGDLGGASPAPAKACRLGSPPLWLPHCASHRSGRRGLMGWLRLEHFTIRLTISGVGEIGRTLPRWEVCETRTYSGP
jgi:hypothetical protein